ncbi:hypothetical protein EDC96DRAFT_606234 [Choanephora cucurbitarum]|nr:hypothetical protein EDC96DRAFT_606234 [Choanephora cucurbitarum]
MKFSTFATSFVAAAAFFASSALARDNDDIMYSLEKNDCFTKGETVQFVFECDRDERLYADLYYANGRRVQSLHHFKVQYSHNDQCYLEWVVDKKLRDGRYFMEVCSQDSDSDDDFSSDDECSKSYSFDVVSKPGRGRYNTRSVDGEGRIGGAIA